MFGSEQAFCSKYFDESSGRAGGNSSGLFVAKLNQTRLLYKPFQFGAISWMKRRACLSVPRLTNRPPCVVCELQLLLRNFWFPRHNPTFLCVVLLIIRPLTINKHFGRYLNNLSFTLKGFLPLYFWTRLHHILQLLGKTYMALLYI